MYALLKPYRTWGPVRAGDGVLRESARGAAGGFDDEIDAVDVEALDLASSEVSGDEWENLLSACWFCHIEGEHEGRLTVWPAASRPTWELGRRGRAPVLVVRGRQRVFG
jgi:hypothetical protein